MESVKLRTRLDYKTMKYLNLYLLKYKRKTFLLYGILIALSIAAAVYMFVASKGQDLLWPAAFCLIIIYTVYQAFTIEKKLDKHLRNFFRGRSVVEETIEISSEKLLITFSTRPDEPIEYDWAYVNEIHEIPQYFFLFVGGNNPIIFDKSEEAFIEGDLETLKKIVAEKAELKPFKSLDKEIAKLPITYVHEEIVETTSEDAKDATEAEAEVLEDLDDNSFEEIEIETEKEVLEDLEEDKK